MERELLQELKRMKGVEGKKPTPLTGKHRVESRGIRYNLKLGSTGGNTIETMILVSVGSEFPAGIKVQPRVPDPTLADRAVKTHGHASSIHSDRATQKAAADLMAAVSLELQAPMVDLVRLCLDTITEFLKHCQKPVGKLVLFVSQSSMKEWIIVCTDSYYFQLS